ncbi:Methyltransferase-like protein 22 [Armadillidium vulgare]|nr:Methyltransferase-like protein 22 [Armadillidium vulgare]
MEAEDKVVSEVHYFSKEISNYKEDLKGGKGCNVGLNDCLVPKNVGQKPLNEKELEAKDEGEQYVCLLGANGQTVLWSPEFETVLSCFEFCYPDSMIKTTPQKIVRASLDKDGDFEVLRKNDQKKKEGRIIIEHQRSTTLDLVGEQVWRGAFYLADFILDNIKTFKGANILEVASGVGLSSIVAGMLAKKVVITDVNRGDILDLIDRNVQRNKDLCKAHSHIKEIDFFDLRCIADLGSLIDDVTILLAADVVYHNQLTDAFLNTILHLMSRKPNKTMYISLEKRYVFTIEDMDTVAPCYEHFVNGLQWLQNQEKDKITWNIEQLSTGDLFQYFTYERTKELVLWKIEAFLK